MTRRNVIHRIRRGPARHAEWLLDESIQETFPASDPVAAVQPGSLVSHAYASRGRRRGEGERALAEALVWALGAAVVGIVLWRVLRPGKGPAGS